MWFEHSFVQSEDAIAHLSHLETGQGLAVDFHPAVKHIDLGEQLALRADGLHCSAEFWLSVMGKNHVLQQNGLVFRDPQFRSYGGNFLCTHYEMAKELSFHRVFRDQTELREGKLALFGEVMQERACKQQAAIDDIPVNARQEISRLRRRLEELEQITAKLYEDKVREAISGDSFSVLIQKNEQERIQKSERLDSLLAGERKAQQDIANIHQWAGTIRQYLDLQELNREIIEELIDRIEVGERTVIDGQRHQDIKIYYRFVGLV